MRIVAAGGAGAGGVTGCGVVVVCAKAGEAATASVPATQTPAARRSFITAIVPGRRAKLG
jgi:hypothetical protein